MFRKLLVANRGEIALRVMRTAKEMGIATVAVYSDADRQAAHANLADEAVNIGPAAPAESYLNIEKLIAAAKRCGADAVHPGYGFLAENAAFARAVVGAGLAWIGPHADAIDMMGDKIRARSAMQSAGVPVVPGGTEPIADVAGARAAAARYGLPLALKAAGGGGGKGLKIAREDGDIEAAFTTARREAEAYFKNGTIYAERYLGNPKHVELQILADKHGNVVHFGERDCSLQRRHQKLWEETPAQIPDGIRRAMRDAGVQAARAIAYDSAGTIECLVDGDHFYFLEMNTRIQVEHTVTEMVAGVDLVREQIRVAASERLGYDQEAIELRGHSIEGRINAEDPAAAFRPAPGTLTRYIEPGGPGVRIDSAVYAGYTIPADYDSLIAKLVVWAPDRAQAVRRFARALDEYVIEGVPTTIPLLRALAEHEPVVRSTYGTATLEAFAEHVFTAQTAAPPARRSEPSAAADVVDVEINDRLYRVRVFDAAAGGPRARAKPPALRRTKRAGGGNNNTIEAPMHGLLTHLPVRPGDRVASGQVVAIIEAMKMMNEVRAHRDGVIASVHQQEGNTIEARAPLVTLT